MAGSITMLELGDLPDVILVRVMSFLSLPDRYSLMQSCRRFLDIFQHPSLWYSLKIDLDIFKRIDDIKRYSEMLGSIGHCCQKLEFSFCHAYEKMDDSVHQFLLDLSEKCRLETLVVSFEYVATREKPKENFIGPALREDIAALCGVVSRCHRLNSFCIRKWPVFNHTVPSHNEILEALCENEKLNNLEKLHLFWPDRSETTWASVSTNQTPEYALKLVHHFKHLTYLSLMSYVLSEKLLVALAAPGRTRLENLRIMVVYKSNLPLPSIPDNSWTQLRPDLSVEVVFSSRVPSEVMFNFLTPSIPVAKLHFMKFSRCGQEDLSKMAHLYAQTLEKYVDETDSSKSKELLKMTHLCDHLRTLLYQGPINYASVIELAKIRASKWYHFSIDEDQIDYGEESAGPVDEDQVLKKNEHGVYYQVALHNWTDTDESLAQKGARREKMIARVTDSLGYKWQPFSK